MQRIAIVGSRSWRDKTAIMAYIDRLPRDVVIVSGGARGVDTIATNYAKKLGIETRIYLPDWDTHGKGAGMIRNAEIVANCDKRQQN